MISTNRITKGLFLAVDPAYQPEGTVIVNLNGQFISYDQGSYKWISAKGNLRIIITKDGTEAAYTNLGLRILKMTSWNNDLIIFAIAANNNNIIAKITMSNDLLSGTYTQLINNSQLGFSTQYPIRQAFVIYENENIIRLYWNDINNPPRCLNLASIPNPLKIELLNFTPPNTAGSIKFYNEIQGSLYCTNYYYTYRLLTSDGTASDFSMMSNNVSIGKSTESSQTGYYGYQNYQGDNFDIKSNVGAQLRIEDIDTDYDYIEVYAFKSIALNAMEPGVLIFKGDVTESIMYINHTGNENLGGISVDTVNIKSRTITQCNLIEITNNRMIIADYAERQELPTTTKILKNKITGATLTPMIYYAPTDARIIPSVWQTSSGVEAKPLVGCYINYPVKLYPQWYYDNSDGAYTQGTGAPSDLVEADEYPVIRIRKYLKNDGNFEYESHSLANQFLDYKSKKMSSLMRGYRGGETYRFGLVPIDLNGKDMAVRWLGDVTIPQRNGSVNSLLSLSYTTWNANIMGIDIGHIDLSDLVTTVNGVATSCSISGFKIVRAPLDKQRISQGVLLPVVTRTDGTNKRSLLCYPRVGNTANDDGDGRVKNLYSYHSPEQLFGYTGSGIEPGDVFEVTGYLTGWSPENSYMGSLQVSPYNFFQKYYVDGARVAQGGGVPDYYKPIGTENEIVNWYPWPFNQDGDSDVYVPELNVTVRNEARVAIGPNNRNGYGAPSTLVVLKNVEVDNNDHFGSFDHHTLLLVNQVRKKTNLYGGTDDSALAATTYIETGHYQPITTAILNSIKDINGAFKFHNVQVFGGDTFVNIFDLHRVIRYKRDTTEDWFSHSIIFPVESEINLALRTGFHVAKDRAYDYDYNKDGIGLGTSSYIKLEDFNYNDAYSTQYTGKYLYPLPYNFQTVARNEHSVIWSGVKMLGEAIDSYRQIPVNNIRTLETRYGKIKYIFGSYEKIIYLQEKGYGFMPLNERVMINNNQNLPVQLGIGGVFDRDDTVDRWIGCQHYYSVVQTPLGLVWFDFDNKAFIYLTHDMKADDKSIVAGLEPFFSELPDMLKLYDNPSYNYGIYSHYDTERKEVIMTFIGQAPSRYSIIFNEKSRTFTGTTYFMPTESLIHKGKTLTLNSAVHHPYISNLGSNRNFFGSTYIAKIRFVINDQYEMYKVFDNFKVLGNSKFFNKIRYKGENFDEVEEVVTNDSGAIISSYLQYLKQEWTGSFPIDADGQRLRGHYVEVEFEISASNNNDIALIALLTTNRKSY